ncbi:MFS transporter [Histoplasma capsulatum var. duboisii H88]|uniref:MFS transporter n=1 Tax=Ajellomyces capsulatus (strain H88) TaxID=544711 RepID=A0A8A1LJN9_AJEC8|nr:MFS transporter [Histoplasma capsulatum var. duboisii H88]
MAQALSQDIDHYPASIKQAIYLRTPSCQARLREHSAKWLPPTEETWSAKPWCRIRTTLLPIHQRCCQRSGRTWTGSCCSSLTSSWCR